MAFRVLIVDDNRLMRDMIKRSVELSGLEISCVDMANDGREALEKLRAAWYDLVLLDINMPVMNGEQFLQALRSDLALRDTLVIVVSTESSVPRIARLRELGAGFVHKPFTPEELIAAVRALLARPPIASRGETP
ncbi:MAG: response regulator [Planctomycetota bacterium]|nr:response regulator [Planctomycetota bacterium]